DAYAKQGFAARELVTRWADIAGREIAAHSEPLKMQWPRPVEGQPQEPATLILRVEGPAALEIQHSSDVILQRVNRFFGWSAVGRERAIREQTLMITRRAFTAALSLTGLTALAGFSPLRLITDAMAQGAADVAKPQSLPDMALGPANATVTITEYASMTCPHCA